MIAHISSVAKTNLVFDVCGNTVDEGAELILYDFHGDLNQQFEIREDHIFVVRSNLALEVENKLVPGSRVIQKYPSDKDEQKFYFMSDGTIRTKNGLCLDIENQKVKSKSRIIISKPDNSNRQKFRLFTRQ